ncbi:MAG: large-conductance mechanosensitive channel protein MscL [Candidatus Sumerlaeia bacterium]|nr:large-conductance mechanosensitive channel protein MscL [Candidatus Sumerlaeia bacterium]
MSLVQEFKTFAVKGNAVDMAVGIIVGGAFTKVVNSLVNDIIMPPLGLMIGGVDFKQLKLIIQAAEVGADGVETTAEVAIRYGMFINTTVDFLIVAFSIFMVVRTMNKLIALREKKDEAAATA